MTGTGRTGSVTVTASGTAAADRVRAAAWDDARALAEEQATAAGGRLGRVLEVVEGGGGAPRPMVAAAARTAFSVDPGPVDGTVAVTVRWELL